MTHQDKENTQSGPNADTTSSSMVGQFFGNLFGFNRNHKKNEEEWQEFPWEKYLIKEDIIAKWKQVDVNEINVLLRHFDPDKKEFINIKNE